MRRLMWFVLVFLLVIGPSVRGAEDCPRIIQVCPEHSIQAIIDAAPSGSIICLPEGTWSENLVINKSLTLRGQGPGRTIIRAKHKEPVITVRGSYDGPPISVVIEGLTVIGEPEHPTFPNVGFLAYGMASVIINNCQIMKVMDGIVLVGGVQALVTASHIEGERSPAGRYEGFGIHLMARSQALIERTTIREVRYGITTEEMAQVTVHRSTIEHTVCGVYVRYEGQVVVTRTEIKNSEYGVVVVGHGKAEIIYCKLANNGTGIVLAHYASAVVINNVITRSHKYGLYLDLHDHLFGFEGGLLIGAENVIPGPDEPDGNRLGAVFPAELAFLMTKEGGTYPKK